MSEPAAQGETKKIGQKRGPHAEMGVKVRERNGAWWLYVDFKGQRVARRVGPGKDGKKRAEQAAKETRAKLVLGDLTIFQKSAPTVVVPTFAQVADEWLPKHEALRGIRQSTAASYASVTRAHLVPYSGAMPITDVTVATIEVFIEHKKSTAGSVRRDGKGLSDATISFYLKPLKMILRRAMRRGLIPANPFDLLDMTVRQRLETADPLTPAELRRILAAAPQVAGESYATMLRLWAQTGMRAGEVFGLQWHDVDLDKGTVLVRRTLSRGRLGPTKTGREREVSICHPITEDTLEWRPIARGILDELRRLPVVGLAPDSFVFVRASGRP